MKSFHLFSIILLLASVVNGCSGRGRQNTPGRQCPLNFKPIDMNLKADQKVWKKGDNDASIPAGSYVYQGAEVLYTEKGDKGAVVYLEDVADRGVFKTRINCVRNGLSLSEKNTSVTANLVAKMIAKAGVVTDVEGKTMTFKITDRRLVAESAALPNPQTLNKIYEGKSEELFMIEPLNNKVDYEIRSTFSDNNGSYVATARFKRVDN